MAVTMAELLNRNEDVWIAALSDFPNDEDFVKHVSARIFGLLAETAGPILTHFHSDLYYDAMMIRDKITNWDLESPIEWIWSVNETGTDFRSVTAGLTHVRKYCFKCTVSTVSKSYGSQIVFRMERMKNDD